MLKALGGFASTGGGGVGAVTYKGTWNAATNTPTLASGTGTQGDYYVVNVPGSTNLDGITDWAVGDWAIFNGTVWEKVDNTDAVSSVNGQVGTVVLNAANVGAVANTVFVNATGLLTGGGQLTGNVAVSLTSVPAANVSGLGTIATQDANNVAITGGSVNVTNLQGANVTVTSNLYANLASSNTAAMPDPSLPLNPEGYINVVINGTTKKIPYYGV
jgi:hypothetical protein